MPFCCALEDGDESCSEVGCATDDDAPLGGSGKATWIPTFLKDLNGATYSDDEGNSEDWSSDQEVCHAATAPGLQQHLSGTSTARPMVANMQESYVLSHGVPHRAKGTETIRLLIGAVKRDHLCAALSDIDIRQVVDTMQFFQFQAGETIVQQGAPGVFFFATQSGELDVFVDGKAVDKMGAGDAFGSSALIFDAPRNATVRASSATGVWGCHGRNFRQVVLQNSQLRVQETRKFMESIKMFDGLPAQLKDRLSQAIVPEFYGPADFVVKQGRTGRSMYIVKKGQLQVVADDVVISIIGPGHVFGEQALLYDAPRSASVQAVVASELLAISYDQLKLVLGGDVGACLRRNFLLAGLQNSPVFAKFSPTQQSTLVDHMQSQTYQQQTALPEVEFGLITNGVAVAHIRGFWTPPVPLSRGGWFAADELVEGSRVETIVGGDRGALIQTVMFKEQAESSEQKRAGLQNSGIAEVIAGEGGCSLAYLTSASLAAALTKLGMPDMSEGEALDYTRKVEVINDIYLFKNLSKKQLEGLCSALVPQLYSRGANVITQGDHGTTFHVVATGELRVLVNGVQVRTMGRNSYFGERALLFDEPRTATVQVVSPSAEVWCVRKDTFLEIVQQGKMQEELIKRVHLHDTSVILKELKHVTLLGAGSFGVVRLVRHVKTGFEYALKRVRKSGGKLPPELVHECALMADLDDSFMVYLVKTFETTRHMYILSELLIGGDLFAALRKQPSPLPVASARFYLGAMSLGVEALHAKDIIYRDLKPQNVMLDSEGYPKLIDFGTAKKLRGQRTYTVVGTPYYLAPEILQNHGYGKEVDMWSLGVVLYELLVGKYPFGDGHGLPVIYEEAISRPPQLPDNFDEASRDLIDGLLQKRPELRLGSGLRGWEDVKSASFFEEWDEDELDDAEEDGADSGSSLFFDKLRSRGLRVPWVPSGKVGAPQLAAMEAQLSDRFEFA